MDHCQMIPFDQLLEWQEQQEGFQPLPVWLERNPRYFQGRNMVRCEPVVIEFFDEDMSMEDASVYFLGGSSYEIRSYTKSWRLWYACGAKLPACDEPWRLFSWDNGKE